MAAMGRRKHDRLVLYMAALAVTTALLAAWLGHRALFSMSSFNNLLLEMRDEHREMKTFRRLENY